VFGAIFWRGSRRSSCFQLEVPEDLVDHRRIGQEGDDSHLLLSRRSAHLLFASVVIAQWFGHPAFPVDTHIHRLAARWGLSDGKNVEKTERDLKRAFPEDTWNALHLQMIYFGREHCPARRHDLTACPICSWAASKRRMKEEMR